ncbi:hypothetical protein C7418_0028 [Cupriavidus plantarum]|uniref:Spore coat protein U-like protein n=2 Tax=Cupriavidus plantarum TaxID=942865 RepID=A0A316F3G0_9BURK|nr:hypothetical protein C7419_1011937 [Cupriavidus plantarum]REF01252.1 hypothetical protein C7418_0028 [Cupriavidus plantarum]
MRHAYTALHRRCRIHAMPKSLNAMLVTAALLSASATAHSRESAALHVRAVIQPAACALLPQANPDAAANDVDTVRVVVECDAGTRVVVTAADGLTGQALAHHMAHRGTRSMTTPAGGITPTATRPVGIVRQTYNVTMDQGPARVTITISYL